MKKFLLLVLLFTGFVNFSQKKLTTKSGQITFEASVPSFEEVKAKHESVSFVIYPGTGEIDGLVLIKGFKFKIPMMENHFNTQYMESNHFPKATFKGKIENFDVTKLTKTAKEYTINGKIKIHGRTNKIVIKAIIKKTNDGMEINSAFNLNSDDFGIAIPNVVSKKISKDVSVTLIAALK